MEDALRRLSSFLPLSLLLVEFMFYCYHPIMEGDSGTPAFSD